MSERITFRGELDRLIAGDPFLRFAMITVSGDRYLIEDPEELVLGEETVLIIPRTSRRRHTVIRFNALSALEVLGST